MIKSRFSRQSVKLKRFVRKKRKSVLNCVPFRGSSLR